MDNEQRLDFLGLAAGEITLLRELRPVLEAHLPTLVDAFYQHLAKCSETAPLLSNRTTVERLKALLKAYLLRLTEGNFDDAYFANRRRIGQTHERVGLQPRWYLLAYARLFQDVMTLVSTAYVDDPKRAYQTMVALHKVLLLDVSLAMDAYVDSDRYRHSQFLQSIVRDSVDAIILLDADLKFRVWNPAAERLLGWRAEEVIGQSPELIYPPERLAAGEKDFLDRQMITVGHAQIETERLTRDGRRVPVDLSVSVLRGPESEPIGRCVIIRDITERKRHEAETLRAERLSVIGAMSAKLAHEIRNPLSSIRLNLDLISDEVNTFAATCPEPARVVRELLRAVDAEVRRIQRVAEDYLQFAKMPKPRREIVALNELLTQQLTFLQTTFNQAGVTVITDLAPDLPYISGDDEQLWQAILNLIRNALEAMPSGGTLTVCTTSGPNSVRLAITDTGKGFTNEALEKLYKPFFSTKPGGTGLGLPLTQQIIVEHGGRIHCDSQPGRGTTFTIELPLAESPHVPTP